MNQLDPTDKENLQFILCTPKSKIESWFSTLSDDERTYASNLMNYYSEWLDNQSSEFLQHQEKTLASKSQWKESDKIIKNIMNKFRKQQ